MVLCRVGILVLSVIVMSMGQMSVVLMVVLVQGHRAMSDLKLATPVRMVNSQVFGQTEGSSQQYKNGQAHRQAMKIPPAHQSLLLV